MIEEETSKKRKSFRETTLYNILCDVLCVVTSVILAVMYMDNVGFIGRIPSESMVPNYNIGDKIYVNRLSYIREEPQRGEVVVFNSWEDPEIKFIKRVVGLPGDVIDIKDGKVILNGEVLDEIYTNGSTETLENIRVVNISYPLTIPEDYYFVMGDNRENSADSRVYGLLKSEDIVGEASFKLKK